MARPLCSMDLNEFNKLVGFIRLLRDDDAARLHIVHTSDGAGTMISRFEIWFYPERWCCSAKVRFSMEVPMQTIEVRAGCLRNVCRRLSQMAVSAGNGLGAFQTVAIRIDGADLLVSCLQRRWRLPGTIVPQLRLV